MRLDLFLKASRLCPRRTVAQKICEAGRVMINGSVTKSGHAVNAGDEIAIHTQTRSKRVRVVNVPDSRQTSRKDAANLIEVLDDHALPTD
jgi:ribosomal 50S subunit-recycling heat shock protein